MWSTLNNMVAVFGAATVIFGVTMRDDAVAAFDQMLSEPPAACVAESASVHFDNVVQTEQGQKITVTVNKLDEKCNGVKMAIALVDTSGKIFSTEGIPQNGSFTVTTRPIKTDLNKVSVFPV